jgi:hypothetical protein
VRSRLIVILVGRVLVRRVVSVRVGVVSSVGTATKQSVFVEKREVGDPLLLLLSTARLLLLTLLSARLLLLALTGLLAVGRFVVA